MMNEPYTILTEGGEAETELKKSRFIAHVRPVETEEEAMAFVGEMKKKYYDARHNCYAYILGKDGNRVKYSDDGEPAQTGGLPIMNVLKETGIRNACIVVTRYFGGTLLGAGPLARMYGDAAKLGLEASKTGVMRYGITADVRCDYSDFEKLKRYYEKEEIPIVDISYANNVVISIRCGFEKFEEVKNSTVSITASRAVITKTGEAYCLHNN